MELFILVLLILVGLGLIVAEVYLVPGFNVVGLLGTLLIVFALGRFFAEAGWEGGVAATAGTMLAAGLLFYVMWNTGAWDRFVLRTSLASDEARVAREGEHRARYLGKRGVALTPLRPTGIVEVDNERIEANTEGEFIAAGSQVRIVAMDRRRYFVRLAEAEEPTT